MRKGGPFAAFEDLAKEYTEKMPELQYVLDNWKNDEEFGRQVSFNCVLFVESVVLQWWFWQQTTKTVAKFCVWRCAAVAIVVVWRGKTENKFCSDSIFTVTLRSEPITLLINPPQKTRPDSDSDICSTSLWARCYCDFFQAVERTQPNEDNANFLAAREFWRESWPTGGTSGPRKNIRRRTACEDLKNRIVCSDRGSWVVDA